MTREEASRHITTWMYATTDLPPKQVAEALDIAITALRAPTREQVEKMRGEWIRTHSTDNFWTEVWKCSHCGFEDDNGDCFDFCPECGQPKTDEAVDMMLERWKEAVDGEAKTD